jgi:uracil phosphoribosyltransferase
MRNTHVLNEKPSIIGQYLAELRDVNCQKDPQKFRHNLKRMGWCMGYEISKSLSYRSLKVETPLGMASEHDPAEALVIISVLRAALAFSDGILEVLSKANTGLIGAMRKEGDEIAIDLSYMAIPEIQNKRIIIADPMLATGKSLVKTVDEVLAKGQPSSIDIATVISAPEGIRYLNQNINQPFTLWTGAIDDHLNDKSYIVPGLGDAGDLSFGPKI